MSFNQIDLVNLFILYELLVKRLNTEFTLGDCLFGSDQLTENVDSDKYGHSGYGFGFDTRSLLS